jgi:hypothetical protein
MVIYGARKFADAVRIERGTRSVHRTSGGLELDIMRELIAILALSVFWLDRCKLAELISVNGVIYSVPGSQSGGVALALQRAALA